MPSQTTTCPRCSGTKEPGRSYCKPCASEYGKAYYRANRDGLRIRQKRRRGETPSHSVKAKAQRDSFYEYLNALKSAPCSDCGITYPPYVMDFDHVRGEKRERLARMAGYARAAIDAEIAKCELVCANCHRIRTHQRKFESLANGGADTDPSVEESPDTLGQATDSQIPEERRETSVA